LVARLTPAATAFYLLIRIDVFEDIVTRQNWLLCGRAHIGEHQPVAVFHWIPRLASLISVSPVIWLARLIETLTIDAKQPAVVAASNSFVFDFAIEE
jgi:hypothetical protein